MPTPTPHIITVQLKCPKTDESHDALAGLLRFVVICRCGTEVKIERLLPDVSTIDWRIP